MTEAPSDPTTVHLEIEVAASRERSFAVFTERFDQIKPRGHNLLRVPIAETMLEPWPGGSLFDRGTDGTECHWGRVLVYEPPVRLVLGWLIGPTWAVETDPGRMSEVEVRFEALGPERTRVLLEHRHLDRHGDGWRGLATGLADEAGWSLYLRRFDVLLAEEDV